MRVPFLWILGLADSYKPGSNLIFSIKKDLRR